MNGEHIKRWNKKLDPWTPDSVIDASTLLAISTTEFISVLVIAMACLKYWPGAIFKQKQRT